MLILLHLLEIALFQGQYLLTRVFAGELAALVDGRDGGLHCWERQRTADDDPRSRGDYLRCRKGFLADQAADNRVADFRLPTSCSRLALWVGSCGVV